MISSVHYPCPSTRLVWTEHLHSRPVLENSTLPYCTCTTLGVFGVGPASGWHRRGPPSSRGPHIRETRTNFRPFPAVFVNMADKTTSVSGFLFWFEFLIVDFIRNYNISQIVTWKKFTLIFPVEANFRFFANGPDIGANISGMEKARPVKFSVLVKPRCRFRKYK